MNLKRRQRQRVRKKRAKLGLRKSGPGTYTQLRYKKSSKPASKAWKAAGAAAGGTLGFIAGDVAGASTGADLGYRAAAYLGSSMQTRRNYLKAEATGLQVRNLGIVKMHKKPSMHPKALGTYQYQNTNQWVMLGTQGKQNIDFGENLFTYNQITGASTTGLRNERNTIHDNLFTLNPYYARPASALYPTAITGVSRIDVLYIKYVDWTTEVVSMSKLPQEVILYFMVPVFDTNVAPLECWSNILAAKGEGQSAQTTAATLATTQAAAGAATIYDVGSNPFHHKEFRNSWKAVKSVKMVLQAGEQINTKVRFLYEKIVSKETLTNNRNTTFLAGLTIYPMFIVKCGLEGFSTATNTASSEVSYGVSKIGFVINQKMLFGALPQSRISISRSYQGQLVGDTTDVERIMDDNDAIQENPAET